MLNFDDKIFDHELLILQKNINQMPECEYRDYLQKVMDDRNENNLNLVA